MFYSQNNETYLECVKELGQYVSDHAEEIAENIGKSYEIDISLHLEAGARPTIEVVKKKIIPKAIYVKSVGK